MLKRGYGLIRDRADPRDHKFAAARDDLVLTLSHDLTGTFPPVMDQGPYGSCTAHAVTSAYRFNRLNNDLRDEPLSCAMLYWASGVIEGNTGDVGRQIRDAVKALANGICAEDVWSYDKILEEPPANLPMDHSILEYQRVEVNRRAINTAIYVGHPVIVGVDIFAEFEGDEVASTGIVPMPRHGQTPIGGHCVLMGAYDPQWDTFLNSWSTWWGLPGRKGYGRFQRGYLEKHGSDFWTIFTDTGGGSNVAA